MVNCDRLVFILHQVFRRDAPGIGKPCEGWADRCIAESIPAETTTLLGNLANA